MKFRTKSTLGIVTRFILLTLFPCYSFAQIEYISLHDVESAHSNALSVKINIVEKDQALPLKFILSNQQKRTTLSFQRINNYMLRLQGPSNVYNRAVIHVYQLEGDVWRRVKGINISGGLGLLTVSDETKNHIQTSPKSNATNTAKNISQSNSTSVVKVTPYIKPIKHGAITNGITENKANCMLTRQTKETLWSIASRYKVNWDIDVFSAMIAIYESNITKFSKQHIGKLMDKTTLSCPSKEMIAVMGTKAQMKAKFNRLNTQ